jgi:hypothetical protein
MLQKEERDMKSVVLLLVFASLAVLSCSSSNPVDSGNGTSGAVYLWIAADMDATVDVTMPDVNWGADGYNRVALGTTKAKRSYIHFMIPNFPEGTTVLEAHVELYHGGKNEDGQTDDIDIPFTEASDTWRADEITWNNQPAFTPGGTNTIDLISQSWSASDGYRAQTQAYFDDPSSHRGIVVYWATTSLYIEKGFSSNNSHTRTADDMGEAPRLLAKIQLPDGKTMDDVSLPSFPDGTDLDFPGEEILMLRFSSGSDWPDDWNVIKGS